MSRKILGIDIRTGALSAVLLKSGLKGNWIEAHAHTPLPTDESAAAELAAALSTLAEKMDLSGAACVATLPPASISFRNLTVPFGDARKIRQVLPFELEPQLPFAVEDLIFDFHSLPGIGDDGTTLLAAAVRKETLGAFLEGLAPLGIEPEVVTVAGQPTALCLDQLRDRDQDGFLIDCDHTHLTLVAFGKGRSLLVRSIPRASAEAAGMAGLVRMLRQTTTAIETLYPETFVPRSVFLTGVGSADETLERALAESLELPVERLDLWRQPACNLKNSPAQPWDAARMDGALALALAESTGLGLLNFRRGPFSTAKHWIEHKKSLVTAAVLVGLLLATALAGVLTETYALEKRIAGLDREIGRLFTETFPDVTRVVDPLQQMRLKIEAARQTDLLPGVEGKAVRKIDILNDISRLIPPATDVEIAGIVISADSATLTGDTDTFNSVDAIKSALESSDLLRDVTITSANLNRAGNRVRFKLKGDL